MKLVSFVVSEQMFAATQLSILVLYFVGIPIYLQNKEADIFCYLCRKYFNFNTAKYFLALH